jgi:hypothetical protein
LRGDNYVNENVKNDLYTPPDNMIVNGSVTPVDFIASPPADKYWMLTRAIIYMSGSVVFSEEKFGSLTALTNGVQILVDGEEITVWKDNINIVTCMYDVKSEGMFSKVDKSMHGRWTFAKAVGGLSHGFKTLDNFTVRVRDNLTGLTQFHVRVQGEQYDLI